MYFLSCHTNEVYVAALPSAIIMRPQVWIQAQANEAAAQG